MVRSPERTIFDLPNHSSSYLNIDDLLLRADREGEE